MTLTEISKGTAIWQCTHCHSEMPATSGRPQEPSDISFCCLGCATVYGILNQHHLGEYYQIKQNSAFICLPGPVNSTNQPFSYLDHPQSRESFISIQGNQIEWRFYLEGVHCVACLWLLERLDRLVPGVVSSRLDFGQSKLSVLTSAEASGAALAQRLDQLGYRPHPLTNDDPGTTHGAKEQRRNLLRIGIAAACTGNLMLLAVSLYAGVTGSLAEIFRWLSLGLSLPVIFFSALPFYRSAWGAIRNQQVNIDVPVTLGLAIGFVASTLNLYLGSPHIYFDTLCVFVLLLSSTRYWLKSIHSKVTGTGHYSTFLFPAEVEKYDHHDPIKTVWVPCNLLASADCIRVASGAVIPIDGQLLSEETHVDMHVLTGESMPQRFCKGDDLFAGTANLGPDIRVRVTKPQNESRMVRLFQNVEDQHRPQVIALADLIARWFLLAVLLGCGLLLAWFHGPNFSEGLQRALALVIVACPCALALATPLAYTIGLKQSATAGMYLKGPDVLERLSTVNHIYFDKTGTLTTGQFLVLQWKNIEPNSNTELMAYALEKDSAHPIAKAIIRYLDSKIDIYHLPVLDHKVDKIGWGVEATHNGTRYAIGRPPSAELKRADAAVTTQVALYKGTQVIGIIALGDSVRAGSNDTIRWLDQNKISSEILSGDHPSPVKQVANALGIKSFYAALMPEDKKTRVQSQPRSLMVGDGANDASAMAAAAVSMAVRGAMELSMRTADIYALQPGIQGLPLLLSVAKRTRLIIRINIALSLIYNAVGVSVAVAGAVDPLFAAILMPISSLSVIGLSLWGMRTHLWK